MEQKLPVIISNFGNKSLSSDLDIKKKNSEKFELISPPRIYVDVVPPYPKCYKEMIGDHWTGWLIEESDDDEDEIKDGPITPIDIEYENEMNINFDEEKEILEEGKQGIRKRWWFLTINNPTKLDEEQLLDEFRVQKCLYLIYQHEEGEICHTPHLHALICYKNERVWPCKRIPRAVAVQYPRNVNACIKYCSKTRTRTSGPFEFGERPAGQGCRTDLDKLAKEIMSGKKLSVIANENPVEFMRYSRGLTALKFTVAKHRTSKPRVTWIWGLAGTKKTEWVTKKHPDHYIKDGTPWWDGYENQECIIIDDFDGKWPYRDLLRLLDKYQYQGQIKGGYAKINSPFIYITCEFKPQHFWGSYNCITDEPSNEINNTLMQVLRRIDEIINLQNPKNKQLIMPIERTIINED
nr:MAG: replication associated protein [Cressdnaviricota sp.]